MSQLDSYAAVTGSALVTITLGLAFFSHPAVAQGGRGSAVPPAPKTTAVVYAAPGAHDVSVIGTGEGGALELLPVIRHTLVSSSVSLNAARLQIGKDYVPFDPGTPARVVDHAEVIYGGMIEDTLNQITAAQAKGRFVVFGTRSNNPMTLTATRGSRWEDAAGIATINGDEAFDKLKDMGSMTSTIIFPDSESAEIPVSFAITRATAARMFGVSADRLQVGALGGVIDATLVYKSSQRM